MKRILDYDEMNDLLDSLNKNIIKKVEPIGFTNFGYAINHYVYGHGDNHVIITGGTHASELISNIFVIRFMEKLSNEVVFIDPNIYTLHFIPILNPEGTIIVTKTIRTLISKDMSEDAVQTFCLSYYRNSFTESFYADKYNDKDIKLQEWMFRYATPDLLEGRLKDSLNDLFEKYDLPKGCMINWASNGRGVDLNSNIGSSSFIDRVISGEEIYNKFHLNTIRRDKPGPVGCPFYENPAEIEPENVALLKLYKEINDKYNLIGSFIYHSCGNMIYYLGEDKAVNPWNSDFGKEEISKNYKVALKYSELSHYRLISEDPYTTMDSKIRTLYPVSLLVELGGVRAHPLSQFMDLDIPGSGEGFKNVYSKIIEDNTKAIIETLPVMLEVKK